MNKCPECSSEHVYEVNGIWNCPECFHEWNVEEKVEKEFRDSAGNILVNGDTVTVIKDLKINGSSTKVIKRGTKAKNINLLEEPINDHDISCKVDGFGHMNLKTSVVKKI